MAKLVICKNRTGLNLEAIIMENNGPKNIGVIGAGAWGTALSHALGNGGNSVQLWALE